MWTPDKDDKCDKGGRGKKSWNLCDLIYGWPLISRILLLQNSLKVKFNIIYERVCDSGVLYVLCVTQY